MPSIDVRAPINRVWDLVSDPQRLPDWLGSPTNGELPATLEEGEHVGPGAVETVVEGEELELRGGMMVVHVKLTPTAEGTRVDAELPDDPEVALERLKTLAQAEGDTPAVPPV